MSVFSRRSFLKSGCAASFAAGTGILGALTASPAMAANTGGYKALVNITLKGGMDALDTVLPYDVAEHSALHALRAGIFGQYDVGSGTASRDRENLLQLNATTDIDYQGRQFALPPQMAQMHELFQSGEMTILGNVGPLIEPTTRSTMDSYTVDIPKRLFSHNDQQSTWAALAAEGAQLGWGGKFVDATLNFGGASNPVFAAISTVSGEVFLSGETAQPYVAPSSKVDPIDILRAKWHLGYGDNPDAVRAILEQHIASQNLGLSNLYIQDVAARNDRAIENNKIYINALAGMTELSTEFGDDALSKQLKSVAQSISLRGSLGVSRQIFQVAIGGFDSHDNQASNLPVLHQQINDALVSFRNAMIELGIWNDVAVFTTSDFGRTAIGNGDGTDHGWGGHHFVLGGNVAGGHLHGFIPPMDLADEQFTHTSGRMIPSISVEQYAASLGGWFGLDQTELLDALPNLSNFDVRDLGLFGASS